jgi:transposase
VRKICRYSEPPGYQRQQPPKRPKLDPFTAIIDQILADDRQVHGKQHHTAKRIFERLRDEHGFDGGYTTVKDYVRGARVRAREMFVPLLHPPGHAQVDFGEALAIIGGAKRKIHFFCLDLPQSDACFVKAYPAETTEAFLDGHVSAFAFFGGVPQSILYDNTKIAVARILGDGTRERTRAFTALRATICLRIALGDRARGTTRARSRAWSSSPGGTSWCRYREPLTSTS